MAKKILKKPDPEITETEIESQNLELSSVSLEAQAKEKLPPSTILILKKIAYYTSKVGLPLSEACLLVDINYEQFLEDIKLEPIIGKIIRVKELEFKKDMLHVLTQKARNGDDKLAQWLLEKKFPEEFNDKRRPANDDNNDILFEAIRFIRKNGDSAPLVGEFSGTSVIKKRETSEGLIERVDKILGSGISLPYK